MQPTLFLKRVLMLDAASCLGMGALLAFGAGALSPLFGLETSLLLGAGAALIPSGLFILWVGTRTQIRPLFVYMCLQPVAGALSDRVGRKPIMIAFGVAGLILTVPIFTALEQVRDPWLAFALVMALLVIVTGYTSINAVVKAELFPSHIRALGVALPYALANTMFGGTAEYVALWFKDRGMERGFYWYVTAMIALSLIVYLTMRDTKRHSMIQED